MGIRQSLQIWIEDGNFYFGEPFSGWKSVAVRLINPSLRAVTLARHSARGPRGLRTLAQLRLLSRYGCEVQFGVTFEGPFQFPHPTGIVIAAGTMIGREVSIYQHVTIGAHAGKVPTIGAGSELYPGCVVTGGVHLGERCAVSANAVVRSDVPEYGRVSPSGDLTVKKWPSSVRPPRRMDRRPPDEVGLG